MEHKYGLFVGLAALEGYVHLQALLSRYDIEPNREILADAARFGLQRAMERMFPGLVRPPFQTKPNDDILLAIRYQYENDPEDILRVVGDESSHRNASPKTALPVRDPSGTDGTGRRDLSDMQTSAGIPRRNPASTDAVKRQDFSDMQTSGIPRRNPEDTSWRLAAGSRSNSETTARRQEQAAGPAKYNIAPAVHLQAAADEETPKPEAITGRLLDDGEGRSQEERDPALPPRSPIAATKLQKIGGAPVFPWERKKAARP